MGLRQEKLKNIILKRFAAHTHSKPIEEIKNSKYNTDIENIYVALGGKLTSPPIKFGSWDIPTKKFIIELDEERHFNRYRLTTFNSSFYVSYKYFSIEAYLKYCLEKESICLKVAKWGKNWKNDSTEKQFGISDSEGNLSNHGSSRWKQRAYYDFLKDISSEIMQIPLIRISIYDIYKSTPIDNLLKKGDEKIMNEFLEQKLENI